jgi:foldase protein PrsA
MAKRKLHWDLAAAALTTVIATACLTLTACGNSHRATNHSAGNQASSNKTSAAKVTPQAEQAQALRESLKGIAAPGKIAPSRVLAHVGSKPVTFATVQHQMFLRSPQSPLPDPPSYTACVARLKAAAKANSPGQPEVTLKETCQQHYEQLLQSALSSTIHAQWLIGEAAEEGASVSAKEVHEEFELSRKQFRTEAEFATYRKSSGQTIADMMAEIKLGKLTDKIFENIKKKEHPVTGAQVAAYYDAHRGKFAIPEGRDLKILRTATEVSALRAKQQLQSGKSFQSIVKGLSKIAQPITAKNGEVKGLVPHLFEEKPLNDAIFSAKLHRLYGPVRISSLRKTIAPESNSGFFLFEVTRTVPKRQIPLSKVKATIAAELAKGEKERTLATSVRAFKAKWRERTSCEPGFVVKNCRQYKANERGIGGDPYTL